jgi:hypothetical protein
LHAFYVLSIETLILSKINTDTTDYENRLNNGLDPTEEKQKTFNKALLLKK